LVIRLFGALVMMIAFIFIALKVTQVLIEQHIAVLGIGVFLFAFTGSRWTWSIGEGLIRYAINLGIRMMLLVAIFDVGKSLITQWTDALTGSFFGSLDFRTWVQIIVGSITFAYITWTIPDRVANQLSQRIALNNPHTP
jgi:type IV secretory pathway TrbL component